MNALEIFNKAPLSKTEINNSASNIIALVKDGEINPLQFAVQLKAMEEIISILRKSEITDMATDEAVKYGKSTSIYGAKIEVANVGVKYDYSVCNDSIWNDLNAKIEQYTFMRKDREVFLKALKEPMSTLDGEIINPPIGSGKESIKITLLK